MTNYDVISDNMGIHDHMLCFSKVLTMENAKRVELVFSVIQLLICLQIWNMYHEGYVFNVFMS